MKKIIAIAAFAAIVGSSFGQAARSYSWGATNSGTYQNSDASSTEAGLFKTSLTAIVRPYIYVAARNLDQTVTIKGYGASSGDQTTTDKPTTCVISSNQLFSVAFTGFPDKLTFDGTFSFTGGASDNMACSFTCDLDGVTTPIDSGTTGTTLSDVQPYFNGGARTLKVSATVRPSSNNPTGTYKASLSDIHFTVL